MSLSLFQKSNLLLVVGTSPFHSNHREKKVLFRLIFSGTHSLSLHRGKLMNFTANTSQAFYDDFLKARYLETRYKHPGKSCCRYLWEHVEGLAQHVAETTCCDCLLNTSRETDETRCRISPKTRGCPLRTLREANKISTGYQSRGKFAKILRGGKEINIFRLHLEGFVGNLPDPLSELSKEVGVSSFLFWRCILSMRLRSGNPEIVNCHCVSAAMTEKSV